MKWISNLSGRYRHDIHLILVLVLSLTLIVGGLRVTSALSDLIANSLYYPFFKLKSTYLELSAVASENERLQLALVEASRRITALEEAERENNRLRAVLGFEPPAAYKLLPAQVISVSSDGMPIAAVINRGEKDSVEVDQTLINEQGLIGRVTSVAANTATIQLLTDPSHRVAVRVAESREMGIVKYRTSEGLILDNFPIQGNVHEGDRIISSGLGGVYPPGLVVGEVVKVERPEEAPFCSIWLRAAANVNTLEELFILQAVRE